MLRVEAADALDRLAAHRHVDAERHARAELDRLGPVVEQRDDRPHAAVGARNPARRLRLPHRQDAAADVVALLRREAELDVVQPVRLDAHVVVGRDDDLAVRRSGSRS